MVKQNFFINWHPYFSLKFIYMLHIFLNKLITLSACAEGLWYSIYLCVCFPALRPPILVHAVHVWLSGTNFQITITSFSTSKFCWKRFIQRLYKVVCQTTYLITFSKSTYFYQPQKCCKLYGVATNHSLDIYTHFAVSCTVATNCTTMHLKAVEELYVMCHY